MYKKKLKVKGNKVKNDELNENSRRSLNGLKESSSSFEDRKKRKRKRPLNVEDIRKKQLRKANEEEDASIKRLEKLLKLSKKKNKASGFADDGLDYILGAIDKNEEAVLSDCSLDIDDDVAIVTGANPTKPEKCPKEISRPKPPSKPRTLSQLLKEQNEESLTASDASVSDDNCSINSKEMQSFDDAKINSDSCSENEEGDSINDTKQPKLWEDIYGRVRDSSGNIVKDAKMDSKYVPPALRATASSTSEKKSELLLKIKRQLKGLLNRLSESNMQPICHQIEEMYMKNSRNDMNDTLMSLMSELVLSPVLTPPRLILEQAMLIASLHGNVGSEIGAHFLQSLANKLDKLLKSNENYGEGKESNNIIVFLCHLYDFKVTHSLLIFDIVRRLADSFQEKDVELIHLIFKNVGFSLRKDDLQAFKEMTVCIQSKAHAFKVKDNARLEFMLETLTAIRHHQLNKITDYDPSIVERAKKMVKTLVRKGSSVQELSISLEDLLKVEEQGRWWIVGSAWEQDKPVSVASSELSDKVLLLAKKQHMNTDTRKALFCIIMTAEDYMDAFEKLLKLNLKQEKEIVNVLLHCALQEQSFNPYYAYLAAKFCAFSRKYFICLQFSLWDRFKELSGFKKQQLSNLAHFLLHLFISGTMSLSVLKVIQFSEMNKTLVRFFRQILLGILLHQSEDTCKAVFLRIAPAKNLNLLRESLRLFMRHFLLGKQSKLEPEMAERLSERVTIAEDTLNSAKRAFKL